jgi:hypothetical protein
MVHILRGFSQRRVSIMPKSNLEKIKAMLLTEKVQAVRLGETQSRDILNSHDVITIETNKHTIILTLESYSYLSLKDYYPYRKD